MNERIFIVEWRAFGDPVPIRELKTVKSITQLFDYYINVPNLVSFAFEDVTDISIEEVGRRLTHHGEFEFSL